MKLSTVKMEDDSLLKVCTVCIAECNPSSSSRSRSGSVSSVSSISSVGDLKNSRPVTPRATTPNVVTISSEVWDTIRTKLDKLD